MGCEKGAVEMLFLAVDDEPYGLKDLEEALECASPGCEIAGFLNAAKGLEFASSHEVDVAFLDIELGDTDGLTLAKQLKDIQPGIRIIFVTAYKKYALDAFAVHATGYLLKPVQEDDIRRELTFIYGGAPAFSEKQVYVQTFGGFEIVVGGHALVFKRAKAKELFALLVDRRGASVTTREACAVLWEDGWYSRERKNYFHTVLADLRATLKEAGIEAVLVKTHNSIAVETSLLECDSYQFLKGDPVAVNSYRRDYMPSYSWAEFSVGMFE